MSGRELGKGLCKRGSHGALLVSQNQVYMGQFRPVTHQCFTYQIHKKTRSPCINFTGIYDKDMRNPGFIRPEGGLKGLAPRFRSE
ncbi:MAG: hypothetical protein A4E38_01875 [Methanoregulaceae archaeon PtaB.Bin108]|nr:MAG: hypothetical protein A4E38_01875 [Methanoregulaceae archaeon PtaB.Bin108]